MMRVGTVLVAVMFCAAANAVIPLIARFELTLGEIIPIAIQVVYSHIWLALESVVFTLVILGGSLLIVSVGWLGGLFVILPLVSPGLHAFMQSYLYEKMFSDYMEEKESDPDYVLK